MPGALGHLIMISLGIDVLEWIRFKILHTHTHIRIYSTIKLREYILVTILN